ncbi:uncharacterized protein LOC118434395 [Folsomia candida]|uniref:uncharacterized protein LOC118434395 n=1 Tax=Folsomia candida TaxID=158441 RepID=UPI001604C67D|nr:uncharacterized protein LOC118434395 [Folsomia candida]
MCLTRVQEDEIALLGQPNLEMPVLILPEVPIQAPTVQSIRTKINQSLEGTVNEFWGLRLSEAEELKKNANKALNTRVDPAPDELLKEVKKAMKPKDPAKVKTRFQEILDRAGANPRDDNVASRYHKIENVRDTTVLVKAIQGVLKATKVFE